MFSVAIEIPAEKERQGEVKERLWKRSEPKNNPSLSIAARRTRKAQQRFIILCRPLKWRYTDKFAMYMYNIAVIYTKNYEIIHTDDCIYVRISRNGMKVLKLNSFAGLRKRTL